MTIKRIVPNIKAGNPIQSREFYLDFLGFEIVMKRDEIVTFASKNDSPTQISVVREDELNTPFPVLSIEVSDVDEMHKKALEQNIEIVYPLTDEPWGVRRFFVKDPNGFVINILNHQ